MNTIDSFKIFVHTGIHEGQSAYQTYSSGDNELLVKELKNSKCNANGFRVCSHLSSPERMKAYLGLFIVSNGRSVTLAKQISNSRLSHVLKMIDMLVGVWDVKLNIVDGVIHLSSMGPFLNNDPTEAVKYAFPTGRLLHRRTLYQLL
ncbi:hypothetical protein [Candidatus Enterovibrio escicola]|uniref:hypothetical protein n=1 Tax=Candidatus Enterovibrio escicola TaxID=1927127 RepID=UPI001238134D|nr:hypothetical protein [Candidatus Enterovibrio escacola]